MIQSILHTHWTTVLRGKTSHKPGAGADAETTSWLARYGLLRLASYTLKDHLPVGGTAHSDFNFLTSNINEILYRRFTYRPF